MEKRYQVFVSSTFLDLTDERRAVMQALLELDCIPAGMELFPASDDDSWTLIQRVIDDCDYYLVILGGRYGSVDSAGVGYTEKEYDYAVEMGKPVLGFLHADPGLIPAKHTDTDSDLRKRLSAFRRKVQLKQCKLWLTPADLGTAVTTSYARLIKTHPAEGWVKARHAKTTEDAEKMTKLLEQVRILEQELNALRAAGVRDTSMLAQGGDPVTLKYRLESAQGELREVTVAWNAAFQVFGLACIELASGLDLYRRLSAWVAERFERGKASVSMTERSMDKLKLQFYCLGLIEKRTIEVSAGDRAQPVSVWALTEIGRIALSDLVAAKKDMQVPTR